MNLRRLNTYFEIKEIYSNKGSNLPRCVKHDKGVLMIS